MTKAVGSYQKGTAVDRDVMVKAVDHVVTAGQDSANAAAITVTDIGTVKAVISALIESTTGVFRVPQGVVSKSGAVVTVNDTGLAVDEIIHLQVVAYEAV
ncbi:hypothetical protein [Bradyrhizobium sp.]|uniref:hypothetical protein n=1 Tax=Bradyrhizobium sp. TaxID=376 RepID=UPI0027331E1A|nr:hypothetical protein [Bradyrhizobium sp.]MDP3078682.1 hypothetical protein [Bradyrhizobium sp.]